MRLGPSSPAAWSGVPPSTPGACTARRRASKLSSYSGRMGSFPGARVLRGTGEWLPCARLVSGPSICSPRRAPPLPPPRRGPPAIPTIPRTPRPSIGGAVRRIRNAQSTCPTWDPRARATTRSRSVSCRRMHIGAALAAPGEEHLDPIRAVGDRCDPRRRGGWRLAREPRPGKVWELHRSARGTQDRRGDRRDQEGSPRRLSAPRDPPAIPVWVRQKLDTGSPERNAVFSPYPDTPGRGGTESIESTGVHLACFGDGLCEVPPVGSRYSYPARVGRALRGEAPL